MKRLMLVAAAAVFAVGCSTTQPEQRASFVGPAGPRGPAGAAGAQGIAGQTGAQGAVMAGPAGIEGPAGPAGIRGQTGQTGAQGAVMAGAAGAEGPAGPAGAQGMMGDTGAQGSSTMGPAGPRGPAGAAGQGITYTSREKIIDIGPIQATAETQKTIPLSPLLGGLALVGRDRIGGGRSQEVVARQGRPMAGPRCGGNAASDQRVQAEIAGNRKIDGGGREQKIIVT